MRICCVLYWLLLQAVWFGDAVPCRCTGQDSLPVGGSEEHHPGAETTGNPGEPPPVIEGLGGATAHNHGASEDAQEAGANASPPQLPGESPCSASPHRELVDDMLSALHEGWGLENELGRESLARFGVCAGLDGGSDAALVVLAAAAGKARNMLHVLLPSREILEEKQEGGGGVKLVLTIHLPRLPLLKLKPVLLLGSRVPIKASDMEVSFTSPSLHPPTQRMCLSAETQYLVLSGGASDDTRHQKWQISVVLKTPDTGQKLSELREILVGGGAGRNISMTPVFLFTLDRETDLRKTLEPNPSVTFSFLFELQSFLSDMLPKTPLWSAPLVQLDSLYSLPPLNLGLSSSESLLVGLVNSSGPTLFSFPRDGALLLGHHGELALPPGLLEVLRLRLEEAFAKLREEEIGCRGIDRLSRLQELSVLPRPGEELPTGVGSSRERQYRALLLLKAFQTVLQAWEVERGQRAARADQRGVPCRLHSLIVSLEKYFLDPPSATINNCEGTCGFPLPNGNNHAILLNSQVQSGRVLGRSPCCVPVEYDDLQVVELDQEGTLISIKPNMVAKQCGCR